MDQTFFTLSKRTSQNQRLIKYEVKVLAAGVAYADIGVRLGTLSPGYDIVGVVDKLGTEVAEWTVGQRVAALTVTGGYTEYLCLPSSELVAVPENVEFAEAVSLEHI